jgi:acetamidase/formamidase
VINGGGMKPWRYHFRTAPGSLQPKSDRLGYYATTALGPDLMMDAKNAVRELIEWLGKEHGLAPADAYVLCSLAADLKISQIVDQPNWGVSAYLPLALFRR